MKNVPVRLRVETYLGYKMVKWVRSIELVDEYTRLWDGQGGFREDNQYYGTSAEIYPPDVPVAW